VEDSDLLHLHIIIIIIITIEVLVFELLLGISETFLRSMSALPIEIIFLLDAIQLIIFVGTLTHLEPKPFLLTTFYSVTFLIIKKVFALGKTVCIYVHIFFQSLMAGVIAVVNYYCLNNTSCLVLSIVYIYGSFLSLLAITLQLAYGLLSKQGEVVTILT
jgi:hypothetical protein